MANTSHIKLSEVKDQPLRFFRKLTDLDDGAAS